MYTYIYVYARTTCIRTYDIKALKRARKQVNLDKTKLMLLLTMPYWLYRVRRLTWRKFDFIVDNIQH